ncbi:MAG: OmpA family protein [Bacteroidetes bacterium]|jgi:outer membrane protein OmpA-like peptidoglycan-associated protein|nr:OmpA family protein [Bacteroidota bacterium]
MLSAFAQVDGLPPNPEPGKCYVKCITPAKFDTETVRVKVRPEYKELTVIPATYKEVEKRVLVKEETKKYIYHPAEYTTEEVSYIAKEKEPTLSVIPASFNNSSETFVTYPKVANWEFTAYADCESDNPNDCRVLCFKEYPEEKTTIPTKVLDNDARSNAGSNPEKNATYTKRVVTKAAYTEEVVIPAEYDIITQLVVDEPARIEEKVIPAQYEEVEKTVLVDAGGVTKYEEIDCGLVNPTILPILWDFNSAVLNAEAKTVVDENVLSLMKQKKNITVELSSHTDSRGSDEYNRSLSQRRADAIKNYLISKGISASRLVSKGYGETRLINRCGNGVECSDEMHQQNRRTEYRVINAPR